MTFIPINIHMWVFYLATADLGKKNVAKMGIANTGEIAYEFK